MRILKNLLIVLVILWGVFALIVRSATPFIADYRDELASLLSIQLGAPVTVGTLKARWYGVAPLLELGKVTIGNDADAIEIQRLYLDLDPAQLFSGSPLDALRITIDGMQLTLVRELSGQLHLEGVGLITQGAGEADAAPPLPSGLRLINTRVVWIDRKAGKAPLRIDDINIVLDREDSILDLRARLETTSGSADLSARLDGFLSTRDWDGDTYLKVDNLDVADLLAHYLPSHYGLHGLQLDLESWGRWHNAAPVEAQGGFQVRDLRLRPRTVDATPLNLVQAGAKFSMRRKAGDLRIGLKDLLLAFRGHQWPFGDLAVALSDLPQGGHRIRAAADYLRIDDVVRILQVRPPLPDLQQPLQALQPSGEIRDLRLLVDTPGERPEWRLQGDFSGLTTSAWDDIPGIDNFSGSLHAQQDHAVMQLDSRNANVLFKDLFRDPIELVELGGRLDILRDGDRWRLQSDRLLANTPHIDTRTRLMLEYQPDHPLFLDLQTDFSDGDAAHALRYYPSGIMSEKVVAWLDSSIRSGRVPGGTALVHGSLDAFPYEDPSSGTFQVFFDTRDLELDYLAGWPKLEHLDAHVRFHGNQLDIDLKAANIYDSKVTETRGHIDSLNPAGPLLVKGGAKGPLGNILRLLQEDALRGDFGEIVAPMRAKGGTELRMEFTIPLADEIGYALDGRLQFDGAQLSLPEWRFNISDIRGQLDFNLDGLSARGISARSLGAPVQVDVTPLDKGITRVRTRGNVALKDIGRQLPALPLQAASGRSDFIIDVDIPPAGAADEVPSVLAADSDLQGVRIALPAPFGKTVDQVRPLSIRLPLGAKADPGSLNYAEKIDAKFSSDGGRVDVVLGGGKAALTPAPGIRIGGHLETVDLFDWTDALNGLSTEGRGTLESLQLKLRIDRLQADNMGIDDLHLEAALENAVWEGAIEAPNLVGKFSAGQELTQRPIQVDLQRLHLKLPLGEEESEPSAVPDPQDGPDPSTMPELVINIAELRINDADLGQLRLNAQHGPEGLHLTQFNLSKGQLELESAGHWSRYGTRYATEWGGRISSANLGDLLVNLGYSRQVEQATSDLAFLLHWPGNPAQFHRAILAGDVDLDVGSGRIVELDPGVTRVVGLLNLNALTRRLRLDFSDFYKKGYSFDSMRGDFHFGDGRARTDNLQVVGPSGRIDLRGGADLVNRTLDQRVTVTPNIDATLPIAGALAGGPIAGLAVLVAQKVMTKQVDNINRFEYSLSGPWNQPEVRQLDSGGTLSKILQPLTGNPEQTPEKQADVASGKAPPSPVPSSGSAAPSTLQQTSTGTTAGPPADETGQSTETGLAAEEPPQPGGNPVKGLLELLNRSESHGADLPGIPD